MASDARHALCVFEGEASSSFLRPCEVTAEHLSSRCNSHRALCCVTTLQQNSGENTPHLHADNYCFDKFRTDTKKKKRALFRFGLVPPMGATATARFIVAFSVTGIPLPVDRGSNRARPETAIQNYAPYMCRPYLVGLHFDALANGLGAQQCHPRVQYCLYHRLAAPK